MGAEGSCAKAYFDIFDRMIVQQKEDFRLSMRTRRPPLDRTNALLSFMYTILTGVCELKYIAALYRYDIIPSHPEWGV